MVSTISNRHFTKMYNTMSQVINTLLYNKIYLINNSLQCINSI